MAEAVLDLEALLAPLPAGEAGAGEDLRTDYTPGSPYQRLRDARSEARAQERAQDAADAADAAVPAAWREVKRLGLACLGERAKDFEVAAWTVEALVRLDGLPGLADGARLITGLLDGYWDAGFPRPDEDGLDGRAAPLGGLAGESGDGTIMQPLRRLPLFRRQSGAPVGLHAWQQSEDTAALADAKRKQARIDAGVPELDALQNEARAETQAVRRAAVQARDAAAAWAAMDAALTTRFGADAPATRRVAEALARIQEIGERLAGPLPQDAPPTSPEDEPVNDGGADATSAISTLAGPAIGPRPLRTREDAIRQLEEIAAFFRKTEPHSPLAYTLDDAVRRARLPLPELLAEVLPDEAQRTAMLTMLGIRAPGP